MPGSQTAPGRADTRSNESVHIAFRQRNGVSTRKNADFAAQWLAYAIPCRRFAEVLADNCARLGADVVCYTFTVADLHHLLLAGLPAHSADGLLQQNSAHWPLTSGKAMRWGSQETPVSHIGSWDEGRA